MKLAVIGKPIGHSFSPIIHTEFANEVGIDISYQAIEVNPENFEKTVRKMFKDEGYYGLNVTLPLKQLAFLSATAVSEECELTESANTLTALSGDGGLGCVGEYTAHTTDGKGFVEDIRKKGFEFKGLSLQEDIVIIGAGGSARSIIPSILADYPKSLTIINRTKERAKKLKQKFSTASTKINYLGLEDRLDFKPGFVINCSSAGTLNEPLTLPEGLFYGNPWVYDLAYSKEITPFNKLAKDLGTEICFDGLGMLVNQAAESFNMWTGKRPSTDRTLSLLEDSLYTDC